MLVLTRGINEIVITDGPATVKVLDIDFRQRRVRLGFDADPAAVKIDRGENTEQDLDALRKRGKLALSRKVGDATLCEGPFAVMVLSTNGGQARLGFIADRSVQITRDNVVNHTRKV